MTTQYKNLYRIDKQPIAATETTITKSSPKQLASSTGVK